MQDDPTRRAVLSALAGLTGCALAPGGSMTATPRMPVVFVGHGSPMNAIEDNRWSRGFTALGASLPRPRAILAVSAHWFVDGTFLTGNARPETIHDFGGFPQPLFEVQYPAPGSPDLAERVTRLLAGSSARQDWGLDHGTWSALVWMFPRADVPVVQLSIDRRLPPARHVALGRELRALRDEGVLIVASGNVTHNLRDAFGRMRSGDRSTPPWAASFDRDVSAALEQGDADGLARLGEGADGRSSHPSPDHWWPMLYAAGAAEPGEAVRWENVGFDWGSLSMRSAVVGG